MNWLIRTVQTMEKVFIVGAVGLVGYAFIYFNKPLAVPVMVRTSLHQVTTAPVYQGVALHAGRDREESDVLEQRDLFNVGGVSSEPNLVNMASMSNFLPGNFKVVGVVIGDPSQLAIEDANTRQTYFIAKGSQVQGITVVDINRQEARVLFQGQNIMLSLGNQ